jgi:hypothetical protein
VKLATCVSAGTPQAPDGDRLDQSGDPARRTAAERDHAGGHEQEDRHATTRSERDRGADQPEADRAAHEVTSERGAGESAAATVRHSLSPGRRARHLVREVPRAELRARDAGATSSRRG